ncbi:MAG: tetratricopeptide repeat protein [Hyphomicrobium sp.]
MTYAHASRTLVAALTLFGGATYALAQAPSELPAEERHSFPVPDPQPEPAPELDRGSRADSGEKPPEGDGTKPGDRSGSAAGGPPVAPDTAEIRAELLKDLYVHLGQTKDADTAAAIAGQIERMWFVSGSDTVDLLMQRAIRALTDKQLDLALKLLTAVVELQPDYAEGWNRRAFVYYLMNDTERSLGDLRRALALDDKHYKALEGLANVMRESGKKKAALEALRRLTEIHPFLPGIKDAITELTREVEGQGI